jgi:UDP-N-acetylglucosamine:LPS N-acetylglucosamine transferase
MSQLRVLIAGGGTGGHIIPALAVARERVDLHAFEAFFIGAGFADNYRFLAHNQSMTANPTPGFSIPYPLIPIP